MRTFEQAAAETSTTLEHLAWLLDPLVQRLEPAGHVPATLLQFSGAGDVTVLRCGGPEILGVRTSRSAERLEVLDSGPGSLPLGAAPPTATRTSRQLSAHARIAVVTTAYSAAHFDDYAEAVHAALTSSTAELAAVRLLLSRPEPTGMARVLGPALVVDNSPTANGRPG